MNEQSDPAPTPEPEPEGASQSVGSAASPTVHDLEDRLRRTAADLANLRKRYDREVQRERAAERLRSAAMWLPIVDDVERALEHGNGDCADLVAGIRAVREKAVAVLKGLGFARIGSVGERFDPVRHEVVATVKGDAEPGTVVDVVRPGYGNDDEVLRPAAVVVAMFPT
jgi:molecular chaperone GrpE